MPNDLGLYPRDESLARVRYEVELAERARIREQEDAEADRAFREEREAREAERAAEQQRKEDERAAQTEYVHTNLARLAGMQLCYLRDREKELRQALADERRAAAISGAVDLSEMNDIGYDLVQLSRRREHIGKRTRALAQKTAACDRDAQSAYACYMDKALCRSDDDKLAADVYDKGLYLIGQP